MWRTECPSRRRPPVVCRCALVALLVGTCLGCYDQQALVRQAASTAINSRLAEVDFGTYQTTLPRHTDGGSFTELKLHVFGTVPRYRLSAVTNQLRVDQYRLRHQMLATVRSATHQELAEPGLDKLRQRIEQVVNAMLNDAPVKSIGFYEVMLRQG